MELISEKIFYFSINLRIFVSHYLKTVKCKKVQ